MYHIVNAMPQPYINPIHQSLQSSLFSKFKVTCTIKPSNRSHDQLIYTQLISLSKF